MLNPGRSARPRFAAATLAVVGALTASALSDGCGKDKTTSPSDLTTHYQGTLAGSAGQSGTIDITVHSAVTAHVAATWTFPWTAVLQAAATSEATGTLTLVSGGSASLTGTYDPASKSLSLSGGGYAFTGSAGTTTLTGTFTGPGGVSGGFSSLNATSATVTLYCGTFQARGGAETGTWNLEVAASGAVSGVAISDVPPAVILTGQATSTGLTLTTSEGGTGTASISNGVISGTGNNDTVFVGSTSSCNLPAGPSSPGGPTAPAGKTYVGPFSGQINVGNFNSPGIVCSTLFSFTGSLSITLDQPGAATLTGTAQGDLTDTIVATGPCGRTGGKITLTGTVSGTPASLAIAGTTSDSNESWSFSGSLSGNVISGTVARVWSQGIIFGSTTFTVTLR